MSNQISTQTLTFNNQALITFEQNGRHYTAMRPICENIGLAWEAQLARIKRDDILSSTMIVMIIVAEDGKNREMICLPIEYLNGWLFGIDVNRCKPEIRETLIKYKKECYQALHDYWFKGKAERKTGQYSGKKHPLDSHLPRLKEMDTHFPQLLYYAKEARSVMWEADRMVTKLYEMLGIQLVGHTSLTDKIKLLKEMDFAVEKSEEVIRKYRNVIRQY